ncbi:hypothetical protein GCM10022224_081050 [Nonomuraea antimicrobica]|uniref:Uncharacterized protein n=1 Tax=Nonomuraea antimicrobica TaxID=561173 RepID=A0ABP7DD98_9ACTN
MKWYPPSDTEEHVDDSRLWARWLRTLLDAFAATGLWWFGVPPLPPPGQEETWEDPWR